MRKFGKGMTHPEEEEPGSGELNSFHEKKGENHAKREDATRRNISNTYEKGKTN